MKASEAVIKKWAKIYNDELCVYKPENYEHVRNLCMLLDYEELPEDSGIMGWLIAEDFDCKKRMNVIILYCKPEKRGLYLCYMFRRIEEIARQEGCIDIIIGKSVSGYKEEKYTKMLEYFGYAPNGYSKRI